MTTGELLVALTAWLEDHSRVSESHIVLSNRPLYCELRSLLETGVPVEGILNCVANAINDNANDCVADAHYKATEPMA